MTKPLGKIFFGNRSTDPELKVMMEKYGGAKSGDRFQIVEIAKALGLEGDSVRLETVIRRWRKIMIRQRRLAWYRPGDGTVGFLNENERATAAAKGMIHIGKKAMGVRHMIAGTDATKLSDTERATNMHVSRVAEAMAAAMVSSANEAVEMIAPPKAANRIPRIGPAGDR